jgi:hypothetical protein
MRPPVFTLACVHAQVRFYDLERFECVCSTTPESGSIVKALTFDKQGELLITATGDSMRVWRSQTRTPLHRPRRAGDAPLAQLGRLANTSVLRGGRQPSRDGPHRHAMCPSR